MQSATVRPSRPQAQPLVQRVSPELSLSNPSEFGVSNQAACAEIVASLSREMAELAPKYFYDALGSKLFEAITQLPEYYPTRTEASIFQRHGAVMANTIGTDSTMIDLGAGNCEKASRLFDVLRPSSYLAIDVSTEFLQGALRELRKLHPSVQMDALGADFSAGLRLPASVSPDRRLFFYPGSSIGNFTPDAALNLLSNLREQCQGTGGLLIGVDLVKSASLLEPAYDDALGVTAAFNLNALLHVNRILGANFALADWRHVAMFSTKHSRVEMHLEARRALRVTWPGGERDFAAGERIHTENSYKYTPADFHALLSKAGFRDTQMWTDEKQWFAVFFARA